jgi:hypothetical protein
MVGVVSTVEEAAASSRTPVEWAGAVEVLRPLCIASALALVAVGMVPRGVLVLALAVFVMVQMVLAIVQVVLVVLVAVLLVVVLLVVLLLLLLLRFQVRTIPIVLVVMVATAATAAKVVVHPRRSSVPCFHRPTALPKKHLSWGDLPCAHQGSTVCLYGVYLRHTRRLHLYPSPLPPCSSVLPQAPLPTPHCLPTAAAAHAAYSYSVPPSTDCNQPSTGARCSVSNAASKDFDPIQNSLSHQIRSSGGYD